ncbi:MAG: response regulator, partial [Chloroflexi bacterium]|nr:response regulator [Chloroflexota bacterium]
FRSPNPILVLQQDLMFNVRIQDAASRLGYTIHTVDSQQDFWQSLAEGQPRLIILDLNVKDVDHAGLVRQLKSDARWQAVPLIAFGPHVEEGLLADVAAAGADKVMPRGQFASQLSHWLQVVAPS